MTDYSKEWTAHYKACKNNFKNRRSLLSPESEARDYSDSELIRIDGLRRAEYLNFPSDSTVLDIGCGPGTLSLPLSGKVKKVTAVDKSVHMLDILNEHITRELISNISVINGSWEDLPDRNIEKHDYVIGSYSLLSDDLKNMISVLDRLALKKAYMYWFAGTPSWESVIEFYYPYIYPGELFVKFPKSDLIYGCLSQMGIPANVRVLTESHFSHEFSCRDDVIKNIRKRLKTDSDDFDDIFDRTLERFFYQKNDRWFFNDKTTYVEISWEKRYEE